MEEHLLNNHNVKEVLIVFTCVISFNPDKSPSSYDWNNLAEEYIVIEED